MRTRRSCLFALALALALVSCGGSTPEQRTRFELVVGAAADPSSLENDHGYGVSLSHATIELGALTFYSGAPLVGSAESARARPTQTLLQRLARAARWLWPVGTAHAHPGHYQAGGAVAELRIDRRIDLLAEQPTPVGTAFGVTGDYRSLSLDVVKIQIAGVARKGSEEIGFRATLRVDKTVVGAPVAAGFDPEPQRDARRALLAIDVAQWVRRIDFSKLTPPRGSRETLEPGTQPHNALTRGVYNAAALTATWQDQ